MLRTPATAAWLAAIALVSSARIVSAQDPVQIKKGEGVYAEQKCSLCHSIAGKGNKANPLDGVGAKLSANHIRAWIVTPTETAAQAKSTKMPPMPAKYNRLPATDIDALVAYLRSLK